MGRKEVFWGIVKFKVLISHPGASMVKVVGFECRFKEEVYSGDINL